MNWARKPEWRIAAKDRAAGAGGAAAAVGLTFKEEPSCEAFAAALRGDARFSAGGNWHLTFRPPTAAHAWRPCKNAACSAGISLMHLQNKWLSTSLLDATAKQ